MCGGMPNISRRKICKTHRNLSETFIMCRVVGHTTVRPDSVQEACLELYVDDRSIYLEKRTMSGFYPGVRCYVPLPGMSADAF